MKHLLVFSFVFVYAFSVSCNHVSKSDDPLAAHWDTVKFPRIDTITVGLKSDSGHYALVKYYIKRTGRETHMLEGSADTRIGNENWKVVSQGETLP